jgi:hypothetical protein
MMTIPTTMNSGFDDNNGPTKSWDTATYECGDMDGGSVGGGSIGGCDGEGFRFSLSPFSSPNVMGGGDAGDSFQQFPVSPQVDVLPPQITQGSVTRCSTGGLPMFGGGGKGDPVEEYPTEDPTEEYPTEDPTEEYPTEDPTEEYPTEDPIEGLFEDCGGRCATMDIPSHLLRPSHEEVKSYKDVIAQLNAEHTKVSQQFGMMKQALEEIRVHAKATNDENKRLRQQNHHLRTLVDSQAGKVLDFGPSITEGFADYITFIQNDKPRFTCSKGRCKRFRNIQISCGHGICDTCFENIDSSKSSKCPFCGVKGTFFNIR